MPVRAKTTRRFERNLGRVSGILRLHAAATTGAQGRPPQHASDLLRAATVFLHATMEDLPRSLAEQYWPSAGPDCLAEVPLKGHSKISHSLRDLVPYRLERIAAVLEESIHAYLQRATFDSVGEVRTLLQSLGIALDHVEGNFVLGVETIRSKRTGRSYETHWVHAFTLAAGRIINFREYCDTATAAAAFRSE